MLLSRIIHRLPLLSSATDCTTPSSGLAPLMSQNLRPSASNLGEATSCKPPPMVTTTTRPERVMSVCSTSGASSDVVSPTTWGVV